LLDVTPLSLGVETLGGVMTTLIERNTTIPVKKSEVFSTAEDNQSAVDVHILQGERPMAADNMSLGRFRLEGIRAAARGLPQIEVSFDIDANGIIHVMARDQETGTEQKVTITSSTNLSKSEIDRLVRDARNHEADDQRRKELAEVRNTADNLAYQVEKALSELGEQLPAGERTTIQGKVESLHRATQGDDINAIRRLSEEVQNALHALNQQKQARPQPGQATSQGGNGHSREDEGEVIEGQFHEA